MTSPIPVPVVELLVQRHADAKASLGHQLKVVDDMVVRLLPEIDALLSLTSEEETLRRACTFLAIAIDDLKPRDEGRIRTLKALIGQLRGEYEGVGR